MVIYRNEAFLQPADSAKIWRYVPFEYFRKSVLGGILWFGNAYNYDSDEGRLTSKEKIIRRSIQIEYDFKLHKPIREPELSFAESDRLKKDTFIVCWAEGEQEIRRLWEEPTGNLQRDLAIRSSFWRLRKILNDDQQRGFWTAKVTYIDHKKHLSLLPHSLSHFARKSNEKAYENEIRAMTTSFGIGNESQNYREGLEIPVDFDFLIEDIVLSPSSLHIYEQVKKILNSKNLNKAIRSSVLKNPS